VGLTAAETSQESPPNPFVDIRDGKNEFSFKLTSSPDRNERRAAPSQLGVVSLLLVCVSLAGELLGLEAGHLWMSGNESKMHTGLWKGAG